MGQALDMAISGVLGVPGYGHTYGPEVVTNPSFEIAGGGGADIFADWIEGANDGAIADEGTLVQSGNHACKVTAGPTANTFVYEIFTVAPQTRYHLTFWTRGDGTGASRYRLYDNTNSAYIFADTSTGIPGTDYVFYAVNFTIPVGCTQLLLILVCPDTNGQSAYFDSVSLRSLGLNSILNSSFEIAGGGGADIFADWIEGANDGAIADEGTLVHWGTHACKLTSGLTANTFVYEALAVTAERPYRLTFWTRGDDTGAGQYRIYDNTNAAWIIPQTSTQIPGETYTKYTVQFITPAGCVAVLIILASPDTNGQIAYFDDITLEEINP